MAKPIKKMMDNLRKEIDKLPKRYEPILFLDLEEYEHVKDQLDSKESERGLKRITFSDSHTKLIHTSTVILIDDIEDLDDAS